MNRFGDDAEQWARLVELCRLQGQWVLQLRKRFESINVKDPPFLRDVDNALKACDHAMSMRDRVIHQQAGVGEFDRAMRDVLIAAREANQSLFAVHGRLRAALGVRADEYGGAIPAETTARAPGWRLVRIACRLFKYDAVRGCVEPAVIDMRVAAYKANNAGQVWRARWTTLCGHCLMFGPLLEAARRSIRTFWQRSGA